MSKKIIVAGGGTGGHVYPGIAIARALQKIDPAIEIHFVGTSTGLECKIVPRENYPLHTIQGGKLNLEGHLFEKIKTLLKLPVGFFQSLMLITKLKPFAVIGVGGYASGPFVLAAAFAGVRTAIWEANARPGMANRLLSKFVRKSYVVFNEASSELASRELLHVGMPLRAEIEVANHPSSHSDFHILHFGGSQGSRPVGRALAEAILLGGDWLQGIKVVHQTGSIELEYINNKYKNSGRLVEIHEFIYNMPNYYAWADLVVCRGGAGTLSELAAFGLPAIIIPLPLADGHQEKNAASLVAAGAARMILQKDLTPERLIKEINELRANPAEREKMAKNIKKFYIPNAANRIAQDLIGT